MSIENSDPSISSSQTCIICIKYNDATIYSSQISILFLCFSIHVFHSIKKNRETPNHSTAT